ncbi:hypothetical protein HZC21_02760 [Candidatus Peregrinibacteria bacterium]|nr:hypothetical protein [Candidatus Peregrinibacteria bacterium]
MKQEISEKERILSSGDEQGRNNPHHSAAIGALAQDARSMVLLALAASAASAGSGCDSAMERKLDERGRMSWEEQAAIGNLQKLGREAMAIREIREITSPTDFVLNPDLTISDDDILKILNNTLIFSSDSKANLEEWKKCGLTIETKYSGDEKITEISLNGDLVFWIAGYVDGETGTHVGADAEVRIFRPGVWVGEVVRFVREGEIMKKVEHTALASPGLDRIMYAYEERQEGYQPVMKTAEKIEVGLSAHYSLGDHCIIESGGSRNFCPGR